MLVEIPKKSQSHQASIQCWAIIDTPAKRHLVAFRWRADIGPLMAVFGSSLPLSTKKHNQQTVKVGPHLTKLSAFAHEPTHQGKKEGKHQESIQSSTTPDPGYQWEGNKLTIRHRKREPRGQPFPSR